MLPRAKIGAIAPIVSAKQSDDPGGGEDRGEKIKHSGHETDVAPESGFDVSIQPAGNETRLPASAKDVTKTAIAKAQTRKASGAPAPSWAATSAGRAKIPAPTVALTMLAVRLGTPSARTNWLSTAGSTGVTHAPQAARAVRVRQVVSCRSAKLLYSS